MRGLWLILVFALLPLPHALEQDAALVGILNDTHDSDYVFKAVQSQ